MQMWLKGKKDSNTIEQDQKMKVYIRKYLKSTKDRV